MHEANPVWGLHAVAGCVSAARLRRAHDGSIAVEEAFVERGGAAADPVAAAAEILGRRALRGQPAVVALDDFAGCLVTAEVQPNEIGLPDQDLTQALHEWTPFEPGQAEVRHAALPRHGRTEMRLVAAVPSATVQSAQRALARIVPAPALAFSSVATIRGARAMGLCPADCLLVDVRADATIVFRIEGPHVTRRLLPAGARDAERDLSLATALAHDLRALADAAPASAREGASPSHELPVVLVGPEPRSRAVRVALASTLGGRLVGDAAADDARVKAAVHAHLRDAPLASLCGAVGAALEALEPLHDRLLLRALPADLSASRRRVPVVAAAGAAFAAVVAAAIALRGRGVTAPPAPRVAEPAADVADAGADVSLPTAPEAPPDEPARVRAQPDETPRAPEIPGRTAVTPLGAARVRVAWPAGAQGRVLRRSGAADPVWTDVATLGAEAGSLVDEVAGASQVYGWRIDDGESSFARVEVPVEVVLVGPAPTGARFLLRRSWHGTDVEAEVDARPGEPVRATVLLPDTSPRPERDARRVHVVLDPGVRLDAVRTRVEMERSVASVPHFRADGRVERGADGRVVLSEAVVERERRLFEADGTAPDGVRRTWTRKMTDG
jgi:hypothetical protein